MGCPSNVLQTVFRTATDPNCSSFPPTEGGVLKVVCLSDTLSHDPFAARKKQQVETTRVTPNLVLRRVKEEPRHTPRRRVQG